VIDGDTVQLDNGAFVRLKGINAPEKDQSGYEEAREALRARVEGRQVRLEYEKDGDLTEDQCKKAHDLIDKELKAVEVKLEEALKAKSKEIMED